MQVGVSMANAMAFYMGRRVATEIAHVVCLVGLFIKVANYVTRSLIKVAI
jgi:hypothetical protein